MAFYNLDNIVSPPSYFNFAVDVVDRWAARNPDLEALQWIDDNTPEPLSFSYGYFSIRSKKAAQLLMDLGAAPGDRVVLMLNRVPAWWELATAVIRAGLVLCPCTILATAKDIEYRLQNSGASVFIGNQHSLTLLSQVRSRCPDVKIAIQAHGHPVKGALQYAATTEKNSVDPVRGQKTQAQDPAIIYFTSGTTGLPKMVVHTQVSYPLAHVNTAVHWLRLEPGKVYWNLAEQGWAKAAWSFFSTWNAGATLFVHESKKPFCPRATLEILHKHKITTFCAPPTAYRQLVTAQMQKLSVDLPPKALLICVGGGEPLNPSVIEAWESMTRVPIRDGYGQTETVLLICNGTGVAIRPGSMGKPVPGIPVEIIDEMGNPLPADKEGDIAVLATDTNGRQSPFLFRGYLSKNGTIHRKTRRWISSDGTTLGAWYVTGDRAYKDESGYFWFVGRSDDVINSSGYRIGPFEVESTLKLHPAVVESAVIGVSDPRRGEIVKAFVVLDSDWQGRELNALTKELQEHCKKEAAPYKYPRSIEYVQEKWLPKTTSGKIKRSDLRKLERNRVRREHV